jgi:hypothetical protein
VKGKMVTFPKKFRNHDKDVNVSEDKGWELDHGYLRGNRRKPVEKIRIFRIA